MSENLLQPREEDNIGESQVSEGSEGTEVHEDLGEGQNGLTNPQVTEVTSPEDGPATDLDGGMGHNTAEGPVDLQEHMMQKAELELQARTKQIVEQIEWRANGGLGFKMRPDQVQALAIFLRVASIQTQQLAQMYEATSQLLAETEKELEERDRSVPIIGRKKKK